MSAGRALPLHGALRPILSAPDFAEWAARYPSGLGSAAFSAPEWQRLMQAEEPGGTELCWLSAPAEGGPLTLPVLSWRVWGGRRLLQTRPVAYPVEPLERPLRDPRDLEAVLAAVQPPRIAGLTLWLAPWSPLSPAPERRGLHRVVLDASDSFVIRRSGSASEHVAAALGRTRRRWLAANERQGLALRSEPDAAERAAFFGLYERSHRERAWTGAPFSRGFFEGVATRLGRGGELCVALHRGRVVGGGVLLYDRHAVHYFLGAVDREARDVAPHDALYLHALRQAEARGLEWVNLGGINEGNAGLARFKRSWGAVPMPVTRLRWQSGVRVMWRNWAGGRG